MEALQEVAVVSTGGVQAVVREAQAGSVAAFERLYRDHVERVYALCLRLSADPTRAEELTQDVFVRAWEKLGSFRGESAFSSWLHRLAVNVVLGQRRSDGRRRQRVLPCDDLTVFDPGEAPVDVPTRLDLETALGSLPDGPRVVFVMHEVEGYTHQEIASLTGRAEGTCKALLHRARKMLKERLGR